MSKPSDTVAYAKALRGPTQSPSDPLDSKGATYVPGALPDTLRLIKAGLWQTPNELHTGYGIGVRKPQIVDPKLVLVTTKPQRLRGTSRKSKAQIADHTPPVGLTFGDVLSLTSPRQNSRDVESRVLKTRDSEDSE